MPRALPGRSEPSARAMRTVAALCLFGVAVSDPDPEQKQRSSREHQVKAAFLYQFTRYVTWPKTALPDPKSPFSIAVVGADRFGKALDAAFKGKKVLGRAVEIRRLGTWRKLKDPKKVVQCNMLFVACSRAKDREAVLRLTASRPVLTVSDLPGFATAGGGIEMFLERGKVRFHIARANMEKAKLRASSKLLKLARKPPTKRGSSR